MKSIIIYYSLTGTTQVVAYSLSEFLHTDIIEIEDLKKRTGFTNRLTSGLDAIREIKTQTKPEKLDLSKYDLIYIGTPVWASKAAPAIITIIDKCDLRGKDIILFATMSSNGGENALKRMSDKVKARGGRVVETFTLETKNKSENDIINDTETIIKLRDLKMYQ